MTTTNEGATPAANTTTTPAATGAAATATANAGDTGTAGGDDGDFEGSLIPTGQQEPGAQGQGGEGAKPLSERIPEKYRVQGADGALDLDASLAKLLDGHEALQKRLGAGDLPPKTPDEYKLELKVEGVDFEAFAGDPMFKAFAQKAHEAGLSNAQLNAVVEQYLQIAPQIFAADTQLSVQEAAAELRKLWPDDAAFQAGTASVVRAIQAFGAEADDVPGSRARLMQKYGRDPDFIAFAASVASELKEDTTPGTHHIAAEADIEVLQKSEAYWNPQHPEHEKVKARVAEFYARKFGTKKR